MNRLKIVYGLLIVVAGTGWAATPDKPFTCSALFSLADFQNVLKKPTTGYKITEKNGSVTAYSKEKGVECSYVPPVPPPGIRPGYQTGEVVLTIRWNPENPAGFEKNQRSQQDRAVTSRMVHVVNGIGAYAYENPKGGDLNFFSSNKKYVVMVMIDLPSPDSMNVAKNTKAARDVAKIVDEKLSKY